MAARWEDSGLFHPDPDGTPDENYSIAIPPPNVTGALHMGHALNNTMQDALIRLNRMRGRNTKWILGTDHAGIATQTQVEKALRAEGTSREEIGREAFVERTWEWTRLYGGTIVEQLKRLGASLDYDDERFTLDEHYAEAVLKVFVDLYDKGLIYRDNYLVNWDPGSRSAISDLEVEEREVTDTLYYIDYPLASGHGSLTIATVRPETILADTAIAVHPDDERYTRLVGETAILPLVGRRLTIIADPYVKPEFGTGALKITPGHDPNDFEIGRAHGLEEISVIGEDGRMTAAAGEYEGMTALEARDAVVAALRAEGRIARTEPYVHNVPFSHRSGERIEPLISLQWFMRMDELAARALEPVRDGRLQIKPEGQRRRYVEWLENIRPWCVSRQLWWGHQIPVYYRGEETYAGLEPPEGEGWERDPDVLDTWFSSQLWPFATLGWPDDTPALRAFYPTDVLSTARDILFLWVARMVMMGLEFTGEIPFSRVNVHTVIQAPDGRRMSKSLGTGHRPDAADRGRPAPAGVRGGRRLPGLRRRRGALGPAGDLLQPGRALQRGARGPGPPARQQALQRQPARAAAAARGRGAARRRARAGDDRGPLDPVPAAGRGARRRAGARRLRLPRGRAARLRLRLRRAVRLVPRAAQAAPVRRRTTPRPARFALHVLGETLALAHPLIPFVTEEIWSHVPDADGLLMARRYPVADEALRRPGGRGGARRARSRPCRRCARWRDSVGAMPGKPLPARLDAPRLRVARRPRRPAGPARLGRRAATPWRPWRCPAARSPCSPPTPSTSGPRRGARTSAARELEAEIARAEGKLSNERFVAKAPEAVVQARARQARAAAGGARGALTWPSGAPRSTCSRSSCSACASAWSACGGC